jgi:aldehyde reductase
LKDNSPPIGLGTLFAKNQEELDKALTYAIEVAGYRHIDTASSYENEDLIGNVLQKIFSKGKIKREDLFITTKLNNYSHRPELVEPCLQSSLKKLQLDYIDLYLIHWPVSLVPIPGVVSHQLAVPEVQVEHIDILDTWKEMEKLQEKGLAKRIGVSNFSIEMLERIRFSSKIQPFTNQVELNLYMQQTALIPYLENRNIWITSYSPLGNPSTHSTKLLEDPVLNEVAAECKKTPAQIALKFLLLISPIVRIIPKSVTENRILENISLDFEISPEQMERLKQRNKNLRAFNAFKKWGIDVFSMGL